MTMCYQITVKSEDNVRHPSLDSATFKAEEDSRRTQTPCHHSWVYGARVCSRSATNVCVFLTTWISNGHGGVDWTGLSCMVTALLGRRRKRNKRISAYRSVESPLAVTSTKQRAGEDQPAVDGDTRKL